MEMDGQGWTRMDKKDMGEGRVCTKVSPGGPQVALRDNQRGNSGRRRSGVDHSAPAQSPAGAHGFNYNGSPPGQRFFLA